MGRTFFSNRVIAESLFHGFRMVAKLLVERTQSHDPLLDGKFDFCLYQWGVQAIREVGKWLAWLETAPEEGGEE